MIKKISLWLGILASLATMITLFFYFFPLRKETQLPSNSSKRDSVNVKQHSNEAIGNKNQQISGNNNKQAGRDIIEKK